MLLLILACQNDPGSTKADTVDTVNDTEATAELEALVLPAYLMVPPGASASLDVLAYDASGQPIDAAVSWEVADSSIVSVSDGTVTADSAVGSTTVIASVGDVVSNPAIVYVAAPAPGAILIDDDQVGALAPVESEPETLERLAFTAQIDADLAVGDLVIGTGAGLPPAEVTAVGDPYTLELVDVDAAFEALSVSGEAADYVRPDLDLDPTFLGVSIGSPLVFAGMECRLTGNTSTDPLTIVEDTLTVEHALRPQFDYQISGFGLQHAELALVGAVSVDATLRVQTADSVKGSVNCGAKDPIYGTFPLPPFLGGPLIMGFVPFSAGLEMEVETENYGPIVGVAFSGDLTVTAGIAYSDGEYISVSDIDGDLSLEPTFEAPTGDDRIVATAWPYLGLGLGPGIHTVPKARYYSFIEANAGPKLIADLAAPERQVRESDLASSLGVDLAWKVGPSQQVTDDLNALLKTGHWFLGKLGGNVTNMATYADSTPIWSTPTGTLAVDATDEDGALGTVTLDGSPGVIAEALTVQAWDGEALTELDRLKVDGSTLSFDWAGDTTETPTAFAAFLETSWLDLPLEVDVVDLSCQQVEMEIVSVTYPADAEGDGVDADEALYDQYTLVTALAQYYQAQANYWLSVGQYSLSSYYQTVALNLSYESIDDAYAYVSVNNMAEALLVASGGDASDDYRGALEDAQSITFESAMTGSSAVPAWDDFRSDAAAHTFLFAPTTQKQYPFLTQWSWKMATTLDDKILLRLQDFEGIVVYGTEPSTYSLQIDGQELWDGGELVLSAEQTYTMAIAFSTMGYDQSAYPDTTESGTVGGTLVEMDIRFTPTGEDCATKAAK